MKYFVKILLVSLFFLFVSQVCAQNTRKTKKADKAFAVQQYFKAAELYKKS